VSESADGQARLGAGTLVSGGAFGGTVVRADSVSAVLALIADDLSASVLFTDQASATAFSPILPGLGGVVCTAGGEAAHLAIVARGLALSCVMGAELDRDPQPGEEVRIDADGTVWTIGP
jgi:phosphoenolpyruvate-protein kinase (PTS system EI component)